MSKETLAAEKAEFIQSVQALFIPLGLFLACVIMAAGTFLIYNNEPVGWVLAGISGTTVIAAFIALIRFQNKYRAKGIIRSNIEEGEDDTIDFAPGVDSPAATARLNSQSGGEARAIVSVSANTPEPLALR